MVLGLGERSPTRDAIRRMAELLKSGATMLSTVCPNCKSPLYRLKTGEVICPNCDQRYYIVSEGERESDVLVEASLDQLERRVLEIISSISRGIMPSNVASSRDAGKDLILWLDILERIERVKKALKS